MLKPFKTLALAGALFWFASAAAAAESQSGAFANVPGGKLWYETCGSGRQAMVLIHDGTLHSVGWDDVWPALCQSFHVVRYDRRGYGRSPEAKSAYSPVDDLQEVMRAAGIEHGVIVGASNGGGLAVDFTLAHPDEVDRLVLVGPEASGLSHSRHFIDREVELEGQLARGDVLGAIKGSWLFPPGDNADVTRLLKLVMASPQDIGHKDPAMPRPPAAPHLGEIKAPTLVVVGEDDVADNQAQAGVVEFAIPGARRVVVRGAGHLVYMTQPAVFADIVTRFVLGVATPGTEEALRRLTDEFARGAPDYSRMSPALAGFFRAHPELVKASPMGAIKSVTFKGVSTEGADIFIVVRERGSAEARITLDKDGRIEDLRYRPLP